MDIQNKTILITGGNGLLGSSLIFMLKNLYDNNIKILSPSKEELNLLDYHEVEKYFLSHKPNYVFHVAAKVFGIQGNIENQLHSLTTNSAIDSNVFNACARFPVEKILYAGSVAEYAFPYISLPLSEADLLVSQPHWGEYGYSMAKRHALSYLTILKENYKIPYTYCLFTNLYGPNDRFNTETGHVIPSLILKAVYAARTNGTLKVWGNPDTSRDFMYIEDASLATVKAFLKLEGIVNIASGIESKMYDVVQVLKKEFSTIDNVIWDSGKPVGISRRSVNIDRLNSIGFKSSYTLETGIQKTISWLNSVDHYRT